MRRAERKRIQRKDNQTKRNNYQILHGRINKKKESGQKTAFLKNFSPLRGNFGSTNREIILTFKEEIKALCSLSYCARHHES